MAKAISLSKKARRGVFGVHPVLAAAGAIALVLFGAILGAWMDRGAWRSYVDAATLSGGEAGRPAALPAGRREPASPQPTQQPPRFLSIPADSFERPDPIGPKLPDGAAPTQSESRPQQTPSFEVKSTADGAPPSAFIVASSVDPSTPMIAIVIDDMGLDRARSQRMIDLPGPLTLSFLTYASGLPAWSARARAAGHEVLAHIPMEPLDSREDPGPGALTMAMTAEQIPLQLNSMLDSWGGFIGVNNHMGSRMTGDRWRMDLVMKFLGSKGLLWLDSRTAPDSVGIAAAAAARVPHAARDFFLDNAATVEAIGEQLRAAEGHARKTGTAVAIGHPYDATLIALETWITKLPAEGLALAPISAVAARRGHGFAGTKPGTP